MIDRSRAGEKVRVKHEFWAIDGHGTIGSNYEMKNYEDETLTLIETYDSIHPHWYRVEEMQWIWDDNWFEPVEPDMNIEETEVMDVFNNA